jgi:FAD/FMN-containing dehydrogenase
MGLDPTILGAIAGIVGAEGVWRHEKLAFLDPGTHAENLKADAMILPRSTEEVSRVLALCNDRRIGVVPQGGRTGLSGASRTRPGEIILSLDRMAAIDDIDVAGRTAVVGAGCKLGALFTALSPMGLQPGIDLGARDSCTLGGLVSTNAGGMEAFRYGVMRQRVLGLEAVLADGLVLSDLSRVRKANTGYDVKQLFIGAEGTLGVVTRVCLELAPSDGQSAVALVACAGTQAALTLLRRLDAAPMVQLTRAELMSGNHFRVTTRELKLDRLSALGQAPLFVLYEIAGSNHEQGVEALEIILGSALEEGLVGDALIAQSQRERAEMWKVREDWAVDRVFPGALWYDVSAPVSRLSDYIAGVIERVRAHDSDLDVYFIGHLADGNLHVTVNARQPVLQRSEEISPLIYEGLEAMGGAFSAEHGIGLEKRDALAKIGPQGKLAIMRRLKAAFDPNNIMNPGKVIAPG